MKLPFLLLQLFLTSIGSLAVSLPWAFAQDESPINIVLIFADDLGYGDVGIFNPDGPFETPRLDRMAREGMRLTQFYVPTPLSEAGGTNIRYRVGRRLCRTQKNWRSAMAAVFDT